MAKFRLGPGGIKLIEDEIDKLFDSAKVRFLGPKAVPKRIYVTYERAKALMGIYESASELTGSKPDDDVFKTLTRVADNYFESARLRAKSQIITELQAALAEGEAKGGLDETEARKILRVTVSDALGQASNHVRQIVEAETNKAKNIGIYDAISGINRAVGVDDPTVYFVVVHDDLLCKECKKVHLLENGTTPRLFLMSEVAHSYHKRGQMQPSVHGLHPSCRCTLVTLPPGFGFDHGDNVTFVDMDHREIEKQRGGKND
jgi:hypothetical protein